MGVRVTHSIDDLASDLRTMTHKAPTVLKRVVRKNTIEGNRLARDIARTEAGPHGKNYYKRITWEMRGTYSGEYGPTGKVDGNAVGANWRHGTNRDLDRSAEIISWRFGPDVLNAAAGLFWPES